MRCSINFRISPPSFFLIFISSLASSIMERVDRILSMEDCLWSRPVSVEMRLRRFGGTSWRNAGSRGKLNGTLPISALGRFTRSLHGRSFEDCRLKIGLTWLDKKIWFFGEELNVLKNCVSEFCPRICASMSSYYAKFRASWLKCCFWQRVIFISIYKVRVITIYKGS